MLHVLQGQVLFLLLLDYDGNYAIGTLVNLRKCFLFIGRFGRVIVTSKDNDKNMLRAEIWQELRLLDGYIQNMTVFHDDEYFTYKDICAKWMNECFQNDILNLDYIIEDVSNTSDTLHRNSSSFDPVYMFIISLLVHMVHFITCKSL